LLSCVSTAKKLNESNFSCDSTNKILNAKLKFFDEDSLISMDANFISYFLKSIEKNSCLNLDLNSNPDLILNFYISNQKCELFL
jgi:hypothetical protein